MNNMAPFAVALAMLMPGDCVTWPMRMSRSARSLDSHRVVNDLPK